jgi:tetratricopeptide (TPR) repeat protein
MHDKIQAGRSAVGLFADEQKRRSIKTLRMVIVCIFFLLPHIAAFGELAPNQVAALRNAITYVSRGVAKDKQGDLNGALADYNQAIKIYPKFPSAYFDRGLIKQRRGDLNGAFADYNQAIALNPNIMQPTRTGEISSSRRGIAMERWRTTIRPSRPIRIVPQATTIGQESRN